MAVEADGVGNAGKLQRFQVRVDDMQDDLERGQAAPAAGCKRPKRLHAYGWGLIPRPHARTPGQQGQQNNRRSHSCNGNKIIIVKSPERGVVEPAEDGYTQIKVTGKVQTPWFGAGVGMNMSWRFLLNSENKIFFVAIDLLASPKELINLAR